MLAHTLLTFYRSLTRHRLYSALNVLGLAVGIAVFLVLWLDVRFETSFERWIPHATSIYELRTDFIGVGPPTPNTMGATAEELRGDYPQINATLDWIEAGKIRQGATTTSEEVEVVDSNFFNVFDLPMVMGDRARALSSPDDVVLSQTKAKQYFGASNPIGQRLTIARNGKPQDYRVSGVLKDAPRETDQHFDILIPLTPQMTSGDEQMYWRGWGWVQVSTYLRFDSAEQAAALRHDLDNFVDRHASKDVTPPPAHKTLTLRMNPLVARHLLNPRDAAVVAAIGAVGLLTLLLAGVNYVNLATARAGLRAREVALRKVMGATRPALIGQFMGEALATAALSALIGLALCELALPLVSAAGGLALKIDYFQSDSILPPVLIAMVVVALGAGIYPALVLSRFQPAAVLASARSPGGGRIGARIREGLVLIQFAIAIAFTIATAVIVGQTDFLRHVDLGFKRDGLIIVRNFDDPDITDAQRASLLDAWRTLPHVEMASAGSTSPGVQEGNVSNKTKRAGAPGTGSDVNYFHVQEGFFQTYGARLIAGRFLDRRHGGDDSPGDHFPGIDAAHPAALLNVVLNTKAVSVLGFRNASEAVGQTIYSGADPLMIVGVIDDLRFVSPHAPTPPMIIMLSTGGLPGSLAAVRYVGVDPATMIAAMDQQWRRIVPAVPIRARSVEDSLDRLYQDDEQHGRLFIIGAVLAVLIGCVGLYGLASFNTARRVREIGIRKTLGASTRDILQLLITQFLRPVLLANVIAWPLAWIAMRGWLSTFDQRIGLGPAYFLGAMALTLLIAVGTVAGQALAVARSEPAKALRHE